VREKVLENIAVETNEMNRDEAIAAGALAFFGDKYGDQVRVVRMGEFSTELCGGTHVERTGDIGPFLLVHEGSVSSGVRRLEALTAVSAEAVYEENGRLLQELSRTLKTKPAALLERIDHLLEENRDLKSKLTQQAAPQEGKVERHEVGKNLVILALYDGISGQELRAQYDSFKRESDRLIAALIARGEGKVQVLVTVSPALVKEGFDAKKIFDAGAGAVKARGGGRPEMVQAGGKGPEGAEKALKAFEERVRQGP